jgi:hypothetical protein
MHSQCRRLHALPCSTASGLRIRSVRRLTCRCEKDTKTTVKKSSSSLDKQPTQLTPSQLQDQQKQVGGQQHKHCCWGPSTFTISVHCRYAAIPAASTRSRLLSTKAHSHCMLLLSIQLETLCIQNH